MGPLSGMKGLLQDLAIPRLLVGVRGEQLTGLVELHEMSGNINKIYLRAGLPVHVIGPDSLDRLDLMLVEAGLLSNADISRAQAIRESSGRLMGQVLCEMGLVGPDQLAEVLRWQVRRKVTRLFATDEGSFSVNAGDHPFALSAGSPGAAVDPRTLVFPGLLTSYTEAKLAAELGPLTGRLVRLKPVSTSQLNELGFESRHSPLLMHLRLAGFRLNADWVTGSVGPRPREAKAVLLALFYLDLLEIVDRPAEAAPIAPMGRSSSQVTLVGYRPPVGGNSTAVNRPPTGAIPVTPQRPPTGAIPVPANRPPTGSFPAAVAPRPPTAPIVLGRMTAGPVTPPPSQAIATPPPTPAGLVTPPPSPALGTPQPSPVRLATPVSPVPARHLTPLPQADPAELYALARRLFSNGDLTRAEMAFEAVARADSSNQRVRAFLIWIHFWKSSEAQRAEVLELTTRTLREVMKNEQTFALGHYFVGALAKLQKDMARAEQAFRLALQYDPSLIEAQRELRLMTLRKTHR